jgi:methyl-accepting chemotaxis protein
VTGEIKKREKQMLFTEMPSRISDLSECLENTVGRAEPDFMKIGGGLQSVYSNAKDLTKKTLHAVEFISAGSEDSVLVKIKKAVKDSLLELEACQTGLSDHLQYGSIIADHLGDLYKLIAGIKKIAKSLSVLGVYMRIESARSSETFEVVAQEIKQVSEKIGELSQNIHDDVKVEQQEQISENSQISNGLGQLSKLAESAEKAVKGTVREIEKIAEFSSKILEQGVMRSEKISQQIGELVVSIQFYDSMHQRIEHIITALHDVESALKDEISAFQSDETTPPKTGSSHSILAIQTAQLGRIISDIETVYQQSKNAFESLIKEVDQLASDFSTHDSGNSRFRESRTSDAFEMLGSSLQNLHRILLDGHTLYERMEKAAARASLTANKLSEQNKHVQSINLDTHILALNSIIKAEHMGDKGKNMKVLAHEITHLSDQTNTFVSNAEKLLESIISLCRKLHISKSGKTTKGQSKAVPDDALDMSIQEISRSYDRFTEDSLDIYRLSEGLKNDILKMDADLNFLSDLGNELKGYCQKLKDIEGAFSAASKEHARAATEDADTIAERYTMQKEREIHEEIAGSNRSSIRATEKADDEFLHSQKDIFKNNMELNSEILSGKDDGEDSLGDNVELF